MVSDPSVCRLTSNRCLRVVDLSQRSIKFTDTGDGIGTYDIFQYQMLNSTDTLDYLTIGEFSDSDQNNDK